MIFHVTKNFWWLKSESLFKSYLFHWNYAKILRCVQVLNIFSKQSTISTVHQIYQIFYRFTNIVINYEIFTLQGICISILIHTYARVLILCSISTKHVLISSHIVIIISHRLLLVFASLLTSIESWHNPRHAFQLRRVETNRSNMF